MLFTSFSYLIFLPLVLAITFLAKQQLRPYLLLFFSYVFYMSWKPSYGLIVFSLTVVDYVSGLVIGSQKKNSIKKIAWLVSIAANLGTLFVFKYLGFFVDELNSLFAAFSMGDHFQFEHLLLPIGISFHTFQSIAYTTDVYRKAAPVEKNPFRLALFIAWFPQLVAGPIERANSLLPQLRDISPPTWRNFSLALHLISVGVLKKVLISDNISVLVDLAYTDYANSPQLLAWIGFYGFAIQIFCDFSGYTDIARGSSLLFNINLCQNFDRPYLAKNFPEFWKRWHISLSTWFFEYLYYPLIFNSRLKKQTWLAVLIVFVVSGFWHGANWTFLAWGFLNGIFYLFSTALGQKFFKNNRPLPVWIKIVTTFHLICLCWVFFRAPSIGEALSYLSHLAGAAPHQDSVWSFFTPAHREVFINSLIGLIALNSIPNLTSRLTKNFSYSSWILATEIALVTSLILIFAPPQQSNFIYFQF